MLVDFRFVAACGTAVAIALILHRRRRRLRATSSQPLRLDSRYRHCSLSPDDVKVQLPKDVSIADLELHPPYDVARARRIYDKYGCIIARGLSRAYVDEIREHADGAFEQAVRLMEAGALTEVINDGCFVGWVTPDQTLFIPAPKGHCRDKQVMVLGLDYYISAAMFRAATDATTLDLVEALTDSPPGVELFGKGQCFYKEGVSTAADAGGLQQKHLHPSVTMAAVSTTESAGKPGGNPKYMHQDSAYFMFARGGCVATLNYTTATNLSRDNGPLYVIPGSHRFGHLQHVDTPSHLGLPPEWTFGDGLCIEGEAGDSIIFHVHTIHGSPPNRSDQPRATFINRYLPTDDYQAFFATDVRMRARARAEFEKGVAEGRLPVTTRGFVVRGRRVWTEQSAPWKLEARVNH